MARSNSLFGTYVQPLPRTHEGAPARRINAEKELRRSVMCCMLYEGEFYESGTSIADRIKDLVPKVSPELVASIAIEARTNMHLRHVPLLLVREMARHRTHRHEVRATLSAVIQRADELAEFLAIYWKEGRTPIAASVKKGLADAFPKFDAYQLAKYNRDNPVKLRDVLFLSHAKPKDAEQAAIWKKLIDGTLESPDTWEVELSAGKGEAKKASWERLLSEDKLGALALIRNLRNMLQVGVDDHMIRTALREMKPDRVLPFRFLAAVRHAPRFAVELEAAMLRNLEGQPKLKGHTVVIVDISGSMDKALSTKSDMLRMDAGIGLAVLAREMCESVSIASFSTYVREIPAYRGLGLAEAIKRSQQHMSTNMGDAVRWANQQRYDRLIIITDEQSQQAVGSPQGRLLLDGRGREVPGRGYVINVASYKNGVGYGPWVHLDGFSEKILDYVREYEKGGYDDD